MTQTTEFPPQAYTKETISEAFMWLQSQPEEVKKLATHTQQLVALYLKDKSQQYWASQTNTTDQTAHFNGQLQKMASKMPQNTTMPDPHNGNGGNGKHPENGEASPPPPYDTQRQQTPGQDQASLEGYLDRRSLDLLDQVKTHLNLSSKVEANRLLITLGYDKIKSLFLDVSQVKSQPMCSPEA